MSTRVLVTGSEYPAGLAGLRALSRAGFETWAAVSSRDALGARSRAARGIVDVPDPRMDADAFVAVVADAAERLGVDLVLPGSEAALLAIAGRENAFSDGIAVGSAPVTTVRHALDKTALALLSLRAGMDVPPTRVLAAGEPGNDDAVTFPAMVKPLRSELVRAGRLERFEARRVESAADMEAALRDLPDEVGLVQPYFEGRLISVNGVGFEGDLHTVNQHVVRRVWPDRAGGAVYAETIPMTPERAERTAAFIRELGWSGVFNLQLIERDGRDYVIDLNPRFYVSLSLSVAAGHNLPAIWASLVLGRTVETNGYRAGIHYRHDRDDMRAVLAAVRRGEPGAAREFLPRRHTVHALFSARDPRPGMSIAADAARALRRRASRAVPTGPPVDSGAWSGEPVVTSPSPPV
jgi:predicted ATP-grasp superfamily ATP-dependent carboligase